MEKIFKAKRLGTGGWVFFNLSDSDFSSSSRGEFWVVCNGEVFNVDKNTICQYTGINDSEGNRIFEGDEVRVAGVRNLIVHWDCCGYWAFGDDRLDDYQDVIEDLESLTGHNIHDRG